MRHGCFCDGCCNSQLNTCFDYQYCAGHVSGGARRQQSMQTNMMPCSRLHSLHSLHAALWKRETAARELLKRRRAHLPAVAMHVKLPTGRSAARRSRPGGEQARRAAACHKLPGQIKSSSCGGGMRSCMMKNLQCLQTWEQHCQGGFQRCRRIP